MKSKKREEGVCEHMKVVILKICAYIQRFIFIELTISKTSRQNPEFKNFGSVAIGHMMIVI